VAEVARRAEFAGFDVIVNVQGDEPFVSARAVLGAARMVTDAKFPLGTAAVMAPLGVLGDPNVVKVVAADDGRAMYFSRGAIPHLRDSADGELLRTRVWQHIGVYAYDWPALMEWIELPESPLEQIERLEQLRPLAAGMAMGVSLVDDPVRPGIDTEQDLERANREWTVLTTG
jgi:3-deoxy-manno-octulosonate cytidylyltransferase (CMP-KDO synthetase)